MLEVQKERDDSVFVKNELLKKNASLESELVKEREIIRTWTNSGKTTQNILESGNWKKGLGYSDKNEAESYKQETIKIEKPRVVPVRFVAESKTDTPKQVNIGLMTQKQLKHKLKEVKKENRIKEPRKNRNGKVGINKSNNYMPVPNAPRKTCHNCGNPNHLASFCRKNKDINAMSPKSEVKTRNTRFRPENPCFHCGSLWHSIYTCKEYHSLYYNYYELKPSLKKKIDSPSSASVKKSVSTNSDINSDKSSAASVNKLNKNKGSKQVWVLKTNH
ncbi:hypothetical protein RhiirA1_481463 [Rhizophagus irregularis]|uniref:CCHC-type domain-containing protein n=1 Tax=Rhizophagus irregularis TaxID=588596 RepID=A0A2N0QN26_9GLOM|nr:hypothetical protein RhiirA1_481463 [Rhizophagus irregularis]